MNTDERSRYFQELTLNLQHEGLTVKPETEDGLLPVELDGQSLCQATGTGGIRYWKENVTGDIRSEVLNRVTDIARTTAEYMKQLEEASQMTVGRLTGDYRQLADFNNVVLAGHPTQYGVQFITWARTRERTGLNHGHYYGPNTGADSYAGAKRDFATRSGLVDRSTLFAPEQLAEVYRCIHETLDSGCPITEERQKCLESAAEQIERSVPDLDERVSLSNTKELEYADALSAESGEMQFC